MERNMTFGDLKEWLSEMTEEDLQKNVSVYCDSFDEYFPISYTDRTKEDDVLDKDHPILITP